MRKINKTIERLVKESIEQYNNGNMSYDDFIEEMQSYKIYNLSKSIKKEIEFIKESHIGTDLAEESIPLEVDDLVTEDYAFNDETEVIKNQKSIKINKELLSKIKNGLYTYRKRIIAGVTVAAVAIGGCAYVSSLNSNKKSNTKGNNKTTDISDDVKKSLNGKENLNENLAFDALDKELEVKMMEEFFTDALPKGIELTEVELNNQIDQWIDFKNLANFEQFGISDLAKKYQDDKKTYIDVYNNYTACASLLTYDSLTASKANGELPDLSKIFSEKDALAMVQQFQNLNGELVDARVANDEAKMTEIATNYNNLIKTTLLVNDSDAYNPIAYDLSIRYARAAKEILLDYSNVQNILMDKSLEDVLAVNGSCYTGEQLSKILSGELPGATNKYSENIISFIETVKVKFTDMHNILIDENGNKKNFENELSQEEEVNQIAEFIKQNNLLATYVENISYELLYYNVKELEGTGATIPKNAVKVGKNKYISEEEMAKVGINVEAEKAAGKSDAEIVKEYEQKVVQKTEKELEQSSVITDMDGNKESDSVNKEDYSKYYTQGSDAGAKAAIGKTTKISDVVVPSSVPSEYHSVWKKAYISSYNEAVDMNLKALGENQTTTYQPTTEQEVSREENTQVSTPIKDEDVKKDDVIIEETTTPSSTDTPSVTTTPAPTTPVNNSDGSQTVFVPVEEETTYEETTEIITNEETITIYSSQINDLQALREEVIAYVDNYYAEQDLENLEEKTYTYQR